MREPDRYGDEPEQRGEWWVPPPPEGQSRHSAGSLSTVVLVHGGYWGPGYDLSLEDAVAADLAGRGHLVWNLDYRSSSAPWPSTLADVAAAYDHVASGTRASLVDRSRVAVVGHSAGGHLALWLASRQNVPADSVPGAAPGAGPSIAVVVAQAPVADLRVASTGGPGQGPTRSLLGGTPEQVPDRYAAADPSRLLPTGTRVVCVHARADDLVAYAQSASYVAAATAAGDDASLVEVPGGHFEHLDPSTPAWQAVLDALAPLQERRPA